MNRIFKTIWNKSLRTFVAVGETGKANKKSSSTSKLLKPIAVAALMSTAGIAGALDYDINGWITGNESIYLDPNFESGDIINVGELSLGINLEDDGENALYWNGTAADFAGTLTTHDDINYVVNGLEAGSVPYYSADYHAAVEDGNGIALGLIDFSGLNGATFTLNGDIRHVLTAADGAGDDVDAKVVYVFSDIVNSELTNNGEIENTVLVETDLGIADVEVGRGISFVQDNTSQVFSLADVNPDSSITGTTVENNAAVDSDMTTSLSYNITQDVNDIIVGTSTNAGVVTGSYNAPSEGGADFIAYEDLADRRYDINQQHHFMLTGAIDDSSITNNARVDLDSTMNLDISVVIDHQSIAHYDLAWDDIDGVQVADVIDNKFIASSETYGFEFESLTNSSFENNGRLTVDDVVDYNVTVLYGGVDDSTSPWGASLEFGEDTFTSDNVANLSGNEFVGTSKAAGLLVDQRLPVPQAQVLGSNTQDSSITNNDAMEVTSFLNYNLSLEQREENLEDEKVGPTADGIFASYNNNTIEASAAAVGIEFLFDYTVDPSNLENGQIVSSLDILNAGTMDVTATTIYTLSGADTLDPTLGSNDDRMYDDQYIVSAEATGIYFGTSPFASGEDNLWFEVFDVPYNYDLIYDTRVVNTGVINVEASLDAENDSKTTTDAMFARAIGVDMNVYNMGVSGRDYYTGEDVNINNTGLNNSGQINVDATAIDQGVALAIGFLSGDDAGENYNTNYVFQNQNSGLIDVHASAVRDDAEAYGSLFTDDLESQWLNSGTMRVSAESAFNDAEAYGFYVEDYVEAGVTNSGIMNIEAEAGSDPYAYSIAAAFWINDEDIDNDAFITNTSDGVITVSATNQLNGTAEAYFVTLDDEDLDAGSSINNHGVVRVNTANADTNDSVGVYVDEQVYEDSIISNSGLLAAYSFVNINESGKDPLNINLNSIGYELEDVFGVAENTGVLLASTQFIGGAGNNGAYQSSVGIDVYSLDPRGGGNAANNGIIRNNDSDGLNAGTIRAIAITDSPDDTEGGVNYVRGMDVTLTHNYVDELDGINDSYAALIENEVGGYVGALLDASASGRGNVGLYNFGSDVSITYVPPDNTRTPPIPADYDVVNAEFLNDRSVAGVYIDNHGGVFNNGENQVGGTREYYTATIEGFKDFNLSMLGDLFVDGSSTVNGYTLEDLTELGLTPEDLAYNLESHYQLISGSKTGRDNYAYVEPTINSGITTGLRYNLAFKNLLADNGLYGDGAYSFIANSEAYLNAVTNRDGGQVNNYCYGVFEGRVFIGENPNQLADNTISFYNAGRINTRIDQSYIAADFEQTDSGILQIAVQQHSGETQIESGSFYFDGDVTFSDTTNIRFSVRDDNGGLTTEELNGAVIERVAVDIRGDNNEAWANTTFVAQDNRLDINFTPDLNIVHRSVEFTGYDTGMTTLEAAAARPTKNLGWLLDDYNLLHDADYQTRELNAYLYALGSSENRSEVNAQLHKALPLLAGGNTLSNMQLLNDTRNNIEDRLVSRLDQRVGDVYMGKKNAWFRAFGNDQTQSTRDSTAGYDSKALGGTFGIDNMVGDSLIGAAFTYALNDVNGSSHFNGQEGKTRTWDLALYGSTPLSADKLTYVNYQVGGGIMDTSTRRQFFDLNCCNEVVASGTYDTKFARASINLNHRMDLTKKTSFTPSVGLTYTYMDEDSYTEQGAGDLKLHVKSNQTDQALATIAGRFDFYPTDGVRLYASALAGYDMINEQVDLKANFENLVDSAFTTKGIDQSAWMGNAKAGMSVNVGDVELNAGYGYTYRSDFDNHTASLRALYSF